MAVSPQVEVIHRVLVLDLKANGVDPVMVQTLSELVATAVSRDPGLAVTSGADLRASMTVEAERQSLGCDTSTCLADLAGALGAEQVVSGSVGKLGELLVVSLTRYDAKKQAAMARENVQAENVAELAPLIETGVARLFGRAAPAPAVVEQQGGSALVPVGGVVAGVGVLVAAVGAAGVGWSWWVQDDAKSLGKDKATAADILIPAIVVGSAGVGIIVIGGAMLGIGLVSE
jgi:hypothetical protein